METNTETIIIINAIINRIEEYQFRNQEHSFTCNFLKSKYEKAKEELIDLTTAAAKAFFLWNKWFAPRILFEGIADPELLRLIEALDSELNKIFEIGKLDNE